MAVRLFIFVGVRADLALAAQPVGKAERVEDLEAEVDVDEGGNAHSPLDHLLDRARSWGMARHARVTCV